MYNTSIALYTYFLFTNTAHHVLMHFAITYSHFSTYLSYLSSDVLIVCGILTLCLRIKCVGILIDLFSRKKCLIATAALFAVCAKKVCQEWRQHRRSECICTHKFLKKCIAPDLMNYCP